MLRYAGADYETDYEVDYETDYEADYEADYEGGLPRGGLDAHPYRVP